ncbi:MAG TPA: hypothetical protein VNA30_04430 [Mycobacteriales bacterium]|nr:hypothetical protein [Mycobacteriales bacterium]
MSANRHLEALLRSALTAEAEHAMTLTHTAQQHERLQTRLARQRQGHRRALLLGAAAAATAVVGTVALLAGGEGEPRGLDAPPASPGPSAATAPVVPAPQPLPPGTVVVRGKVSSLSVRQNLAFAAGSLWSVDRTGSALLRVDPATGREQSRVSLQLPPGYAAEAVTAAGPRVVVTATTKDRTVTQADATNAAYLVVDAARARQSASVPGAVDFGQDGNRVAVGGAGIWVQTKAQELGLLDPSAGRVTRKVPVPSPINGFAVGATTIWVASYDEGSATRIDAATGSATTTKVAESTINAVTVGDDSLIWHSGTVVRLAGAPPREVGSISLTLGVGGKADFAVAGDSIYCVCGTRGDLTIASASLAAGSAYEIESSGADTSLTFASGRLWLLLPDGTLLGLDPGRF